MLAISYESDNSWPTNTVVTICRSCTKTAKLMLCSKCHNTGYCSKACQKMHWEEHKNYCNSNSVTDPESGLYSFFQDISKKLLVGRHFFTRKIAWAVPSIDVINIIDGFCKQYNITTILEIGSGHGVLAMLLKMFRYKVHATDALVSHGLEDECNPEFFTEVEHLDHIQAIKKYVTDEEDKEKVPNTLLICWPTLNDSMAAEAVEEFTRASIATPTDKYIIYIGESVGGCCGDDIFFDILERDWHVVTNFDVPNWPGIYDSGLILVYNGDRK